MKKRLTVKEMPLAVVRQLALRERRREEGDFEAGDAIRDDLVKAGYELRDETGELTVWVEELGRKPQAHFLVLFGSGETMAAGGRAHEAVIKGMGVEQPHIALVTTPAGFQPNVDRVYGDIADYLQTRLKNYHPRITIVEAHARESMDTQQHLETILQADYIFMGPGSPTYATTQLRETRVLEAIVTRAKDGASLGLASAAAIAFSQFALPVYEIYKVGEPLHWVDGLGVYSRLLEKDVTVVPHYNNREGGEKTDTSRCFMGMERYGALLRLLPVGTDIWGIDEQTAVMIEMKSTAKRIWGMGQLTEYRTGE